jgi:hypothetical protein
VSDKRGDFSLVNLDAGAYTVIITASSFQVGQFQDLYLMRARSFAWMQI